MNDEYTPEVIEFWLRHWPMLVSATEGGTSSCGVGAGNGGRFSLVCLKADLESAADSLPLHWASTARIFKRQQRWRVYLERQAGARGGEDDLGVETCFERMARHLGWQAGTAA